MIQKIAFVLIFLASYGIFFKGLNSSLESLPFVGVPLSGFLTNWLISLLFLWVCTIIPFSLSSSYYEFKKFERDRRIYERLGVKTVQPIIKFLGLIKFSGDRSDLRELVKYMRNAELNHMLTLAMVYLLALAAVLGSYWEYAFWLMVFNILFNVYPIMLQRYNRIRLEPIARRYEMKHYQPKVRTKRDHIRPAPN